MDEPKDLREVPEDIENDDMEEMRELYASCRSGFEQKLEVGRLLTDPPIWASECGEIAEKLISKPGHMRMALTGGIASGKSTVASLLVERGAAHIDFDMLSRQAVEPGSPGFTAVADLLGPGYVTAEGTLNRLEIGRAVFSDGELKKRLEDIIHPVVWSLMGHELDLYADKPVVLINVPLLFEAGLESFFSPIIMVFASAETQFARLMARNPELGSEVAGNILASQWPAPPKVIGSTYIIDNNGSLQETVKQVDSIWSDITRAKL